MKLRGQTERKPADPSESLGSVPGNHAPVMVVRHSDRSVTRFKSTHVRTNPSLEQAHLEEKFGGLSSPESRGTLEPIRIPARTHVRGLRPDCRETSLRREPPCNPNRRT